MDICIYISMYTYIYIYIYVCRYIYMYIYIYTFFPRRVCFPGSGPGFGCRVRVSVSGCLPPRGLDSWFRFQFRSFGPGFGFRMSSPGDSRFQVLVRISDFESVFRLQGGDRFRVRVSDSGASLPPPCFWVAAIRIYSSSSLLSYRS